MFIKFSIKYASQNFNQSSDDALSSSTALLQAAAAAAAGLDCHVCRRFKFMHKLDLDNIHFTCFAVCFEMSM